MRGYYFNNFLHFNRVFENDTKEKSRHSVAEKVSTRSHRSTSKAKCDRTLISWTFFCNHRFRNVNWSSLSFAVPVAPSSQQLPPFCCCALHVFNGAFGFEIAKNYQLLPSARFRKTCHVSDSCAVTVYFGALFSEFGFFSEFAKPRIPSHPRNWCFVMKFVCVSTFLSFPLCPGAPVELFRFRRKAKVKDRKLQK